MPDLRAAGVMFADQRPLYQRVRLPRNERLPNGESWLLRTLMVFVHDEPNAKATLAVSSDCMMVAEASLQTLWWATQRFARVADALLLRDTHDALAKEALVTRVELRLGAAEEAPLSAWLGTALDRWQALMKRVHEDLQLFPTVPLVFRPGADIEFWIYDHVGVVEADLIGVRSTEVTW